MYSESPTSVLGLPVLELSSDAPEGMHEQEAGVPSDTETQTLTFYHRRRAFEIVLWPPYQCLPSYPTPVTS